MKQNMAAEWLKASYSDLVLIGEIIENEYLTHMVAFHSQQSLEKSFKAILEFHRLEVPKKHDLLVLKDLIVDYFVMDDEELLEDLNELYIDSRYPGSFGLLPNGKPTLEDACEFYDFAQDTFDKICKILEIDNWERKSDSN
jgi:HEPN domain-containing protein